ncbi:hypothetical protein JB92DRAFT_3106701 [Gautieria morchelliformis]|nr:hypothetical protein JB92DRAFT_3106701 [Gautieria morchelliformis]
MSSDGYFDDSGQLDSAFLAELDAIEVAHSNATQHPSQPTQTQPLSSTSRSNFESYITLKSPEESGHRNATSNGQPAPVPIDVDADDSYDQFFDDIDPRELERLDEDVEQAYKHPLGIPRTNSASGSGVTRQLTLFGDLVSQAPSRRPCSQQQNQTRPHSPRRPFGKKARKVKQWDRTAFAKSGWKSSKGKGKGKGKDVADCELDADDATQEFEQFPPPIPDKYSFRCSTQPPPFKHVADLLAAQTWIYPTNRPKRDYQFNIVKDSLFENSLVALPTGLGKTFIAGVLMLNYYRWFPEGKVVFVAPTKPLVAQQIDACHQTCGIPGGDAAELTGQIPRSSRAQAWAEKRVFFMTPQTFMNDLRTENCNPTDIVLLVIDEAHKATGNYAYAQIVRYLMAKSAHFRVLALTATPGSKPEAVQDIVDSLHISNVEIRDENSLDLRDYILPKKISTHVVKMTADVIKIRDMLAKLMERIAKRMCETGLLPNLNVVTLHPYRCSALIQQFSGDGTGKKFPWVYPVLKKLGALARAMGYLLECSIGMCHDELHDMVTEGEQDGKKPSGLRSDPLFREIVTELERQHNTGFSLHPKLDKLQSLTVDYFAQAQADADEARDRNATAEDGNTKLMVFTNFRASVDEIVKVLNAHQPMIRATRFIGQGSDKRGRKGIAQKDQLEVIKQFKAGVYNVLVATSIGEEGLDIGEVDMIICYDAQKTPIRMLQRVGRTGRKRAGRVEVLLSESREEANWDKAKEHYETVQASIMRGETLELFADVDRLLPDHIKPKCLETNMVMEEYVRDTKPSKSNVSAPKGTKRKRNADVTRNIPDGAVNGFVPSSKLIPKRDSKKRKVATMECTRDEAKDDDRTVKSDIQGPPRGKPGSKGKARAKAKETTTMPRKKTGSVKDRGRKSPAFKEMSLSQLDRELADDTDDMELELGINWTSPEQPLDASSSMKSPLHSQSSPISIRSSPEPTVTATTADDGFALRSLPLQRAQSVGDHSWLLDSDDDIKVIEDFDPSINLCHSSKLGNNGHTSPQGLSSFRRSPLSHVPSGGLRTLNSMLLPPGYENALTSNSSPQSTFPIRHPGVRRKRPQISSSPSIDPRSEKNQLSSPASSPPCASVRSKKPRCIDSRALELLDLEAQVSGDETMGGSSDHEDVESESDRRFVEELPPTQAPSRYDQTLAYRHSLFTQLPGGSSRGPQFASKPTRRGKFGPERQYTHVDLSSSPTPADQYSMDSFVVEDDDDVLQESHSSSI